MMLYLIAKSTGKGFIMPQRRFSISGYSGDVWAIDDNIHAQRWAEEQVRFADGQIVDKGVAQTAVNNATKDFDDDGNPIIPPTL